MIKRILGWIILITLGAGLLYVVCSVIAVVFGMEMLKTLAIGVVVAVLLGNLAVTWILGY